MQVFKLFFQIARSKIPSGLVYVIVFFAVLIPMTKLFASNSEFTETKLSVVIFDEDGSTESKRLIDNIAKKNKIKDIKNDSQILLDAMYYEQVDYCLTIKKGYGEKLAKTDAADVKESLFSTYHLHDSYATAMMEQFLDEYVRMVRSYVAGGNDVMAAIDKTEDKIGVEAEVAYAEFDNGMVKDENYPQSLGAIFRFSPYIFISVLMNVLSPILLVMRKKDQRYRINCSSIRVTRYTAQVFAGSAFLVLGVWLFFMIGGVFIHGSMYQGAYAWIAVANSLIFALIAAAIAILVASFNPSENIVSMITQCVGLSMCFLCGVFVPQTMMSDGVLAAAKFLPAYWFEKANDILVGDQAGTMGDVGICLLVEVGFLLALILVTVLVSRQRPAGAVRKVRIKEAA